MNNVKRIIAAGLVGTAVISTGVVASAATYEENLQSALKAAKVPDSLATQLTSLASAYNLSEEEGKKLQAIADSAIQKTANYSTNDIYNDKDGILTDLQVNEKAELETLLHVTITGSPSTGVAVFKKDATTGKNTKIFELSVSDAKSLLKGSGMSRDGAKSMIPSLVAYMVADDKKATVPSEGGSQGGNEGGNQGGNQGGNEGTASTTPDEKDNNVLDTNLREKLNKKLDAIVAPDSWTAEQKQAFEKAKDAISKLINGEFTDADLAAARALVDKLPNGSVKDELLAILDEIDAKAKPVSSANPGNGENTKPGTTAKTATNFGNVAVAGLGLMTVAGAVFVISKKKIC